MIHITDKHNCCGCEACVQKCPNKCISAFPDEEGFLYPVVDEALCVNCGLCDEVCPMLREPHRGEEVLAAYAAYVADEELRQKSSSGGLFSALAADNLQQGGVVFGAAMDGPYSVCHTAVSEEKELDALRGSKYLQSHIHRSFARVQRYLRRGKPVLFTGTACEVAGLKGFLGKEYENLVTVDVLCHGVPSPAVWKAYVKEHEGANGSSVRTIDFRNKSQGWNEFSMKLRFADGRTYEESFRKDPFMQLFLRNAILRPSCHACPFKALERDSDLTVGDAWGVEDVFPDFSDDKVTSVVLVHTERGAELLERVRDGLVLKEGDADALLPPAADSRKSVAPHPNREKVFQQFRKNKPVSGLVKYTEPNVLQKALRRLVRITTHS